VSAAEERHRELEQEREKKAEIDAVWKSQGWNPEEFHGHAGSGAREKWSHRELTQKYDRKTLLKEMHPNTYSLIDFVPKALQEKKDKETKDRENGIAKIKRLFQISNTSLSDEKLNKAADNFAAEMDRREISPREGFNRYYTSESAVKWIEAYNGMTSEELKTYIPE